MKAVCRILMVCTVVCFVSVPITAQQGQIDPVGAMAGSQFGRVNPYTFMEKRWYVAGRVATLQGNAIPGARVDVEPLVSAEFRSFRTDLAGEFQTAYDLNAEAVSDFRVRLTVTKKGFLTAHEIIDYGSSGSPKSLLVTLRPENPDPDLLSQEQLTSKLGPRLKALGPSDRISAKSAKDYDRGVAEFLDRNRPDRSLDHFTKVVKRDSGCSKCWTMLALAELNSGDWDGAIRDVAVGVNQTLKDPKTGSPEAMLLYGVMESWKHDPQTASDYLAEALTFNARDALALQEVGRAQLQIQKWAFADAYLSKAIAAGAGPEARLLRVEALLGEGRPDEANHEMTRYLDRRNVKSMPLRVREIWAEVQDRKKIAAIYGASNAAKLRKKSAKAVDYLHGPIPELKGLQPAKNQDDLKPILAAVGKNVVAFFRDFQNSSSLEEIQQEKLSHKGKIAGTREGKYHYLCLVSSDPTAPGFTEYRENVIGDKGMPGGLKEGFMLTSGFASAALIFHPAYQSESTFRYLGRQKVDGHEAYVIAYAQQPMKARLVGIFKCGYNTAATFTQGLAWIDVRNYQIIRMRTDLLKPLPEVRLLEQTTQIDYQEVRFKSSSEGFWLPRDVAVTVAYNGRTLRNEHQYSDFRLFNVGTTEKIGKPKEPAQISKDGAKPPARH